MNMDLVVPIIITLIGASTPILIAALGEGGQVVLASPSRKLVVVRLGQDGPGENPVLMARLATLVGLFRPGAAD